MSINGQFPIKLLTKREHLAACAMRGILSNTNDTRELNNVTEDQAARIVARAAITCADALLRELEATR